MTIGPYRKIGSLFKVCILNFGKIIPMWHIVALMFRALSR